MAKKGLEQNGERWRLFGGENLLMGISLSFPWSNCQVKRRNHFIDENVHQNKLIMNKTSQSVIHPFIHVISDRLQQYLIKLLILSNRMK